MVLQLQKANNFQWEVYLTSWGKKKKKIFSRNKENYVFVQVRDTGFL